MGEGKGNEYPSLGQKESWGSMPDGGDGIRSTGTQGTLSGCGVSNRPGLSCSSIDTTRAQCDRRGPEGEERSRKASPRGLMFGEFWENGLRPKGEDRRLQVVRTAWNLRFCFINLYLFLSFLSTSVCI
jgi:hypothetical protein